MLNSLRQLQNRIPLAVRGYWSNYSLYIVLIMSAVAFWLFHSERCLTLYLESTPKLDPYTQNRFRSAGYKFGYMAAYAILRFVYAPQQALPWLGVLWSLAVINYRFFMKTWVFKGRWLGIVFYPIFAVIILQGAYEGLLQLAVGLNEANATIAWWVLGWCVIYGIWNYFREINQTRRALTETSTQAELTALKAQVNPHFLFNSLNNIFGTALTEGGQRTPDGVQQLSRLIRYQLEQIQATNVDVGDELRFVDEYVTFHRQLVADNQSVTFSYDWDEQPATLPPLLLTSLIDYALQQAGPVGMTGKLSVQQQLLHLQLTYSATSLTTTDDAFQNIRQRLTLLYPDRYTLDERVAGKRATTDFILQLTN